MPAVNKDSSELLKEGYHHLRHPEEYKGSFASPAFEARLRVLRKRTAPPLPSLKAVFQMLVDTWKEAGKTWDAEVGKKADPTALLKK